MQSDKVTIHKAKIKNMFILKVKILKKVARKVNIFSSL